MNVITKYLKEGHPYRCGRPSNMKWVTIHSTANPLSNADGERAWLDNPSNKRQASWHYCVDQTHIVSAIPESEEAWHSGTSEGNKTSIGIEICESGNRSATLKLAAEFVASILKKHGWGIDKLKRHYDWSGKICPGIFYDNGKWTGWTEFKQMVQKELSQVKKVLKTGNVTADVLNVRTGPAASYKDVGDLKRGDKVEIHETKNGWYRIGDKTWVSAAYVKTE